MRTASSSLLSLRTLARVFLATIVVGLGLAAAALLWPGPTAAADPIWACYSNSNFSLRAVTGPGSCAGNETAVRLDDSDNPIWICLHPQPGHIRFAGPADDDPITGNCWGAGSTQYFQVPGDDAITLCVQNSSGVLSYPPCGPNQTQLVIPPRNRAPVAQDQSVSVDEDDDVQITLSATDADDDDLTFAIVDGPDNGDLGSLGAPDCTAATTCTATVTYTPDADFSGSDSFTFKVNDGSVDSNVATVSITVNPINDAPTDIALSNDSVDENQPAGTLVGTFSTTDPDPGDTFTYTLVSGSGSTDNGDFQIVGDQLQTAHGLNFEPAPERSIRVRTDDGNGGSFEEVFTIHVNDVNEQPTDIALSNDSVDENQPAGTLVGTFSTTDPDSGDTFTYTLVSGSGDADNDDFQIVGDQLQTAHGLNFEPAPERSIRVRSTDAGSLSVEEVFTITVNDVNEAPTDIALSNTTIDENVAANFVVGTFSTTDPDTGDTFTYTLVPGAGATDNGAFNILGSDLRITNSPNFETQSSYSIRVRSTDAGALFTEKQFTITITDLNEAPTAGTDNYDAIGNTQLRINNPTSPGTSVAFTTSGTSPLANDTDPDTNPSFNTLQVTAVGSCTKGGTLTLHASDHSDGRLVYLPPQGTESTSASDTDDCTYTLSDGTNNVSGTVKVQITDMVWYVDNAAPAGGDGRSTAVYNSLTPLNGAGGSGDEDDAADYIFLFQGNANYTTGLVLESNQRFFGQPNGLTVGATTLIAGSGSNPTLTNASGAGITLANAVDVERIDVANTSGAGVTGTAVTSATIGGNASITNTGGNGFELSGSAGGAVSVGASISNTTGKQVSIQDRTSGTVTLSGAVSGTGTGVQLQNNANTTNFTGTLTLSTGANAAFTATNPSLQGTLSVDPVGTNNNTLTTTTGTALIVTNTTISANGLEFKSISAGTSGTPVNGILLNNTGTSGGLTVLGGGSTAQGGDSSGGTIQNTSSFGISLTNTANPSFNNMNIQNTDDSGISGTQVTNFTFTDGTINGAGNGSNEGSISLDSSLTNPNVTGTVTVTNNKLTLSDASGVNIRNPAGTLSSVTISNNLLSGDGPGAVTGAAAKIVGLSATANVTKATLADNTISGFDEAGFVLQANGGNIGIAGDATNKVSVTGNSFDGGNLGIGNQPDRFVTAAAGGSGPTSGGQGNFDISDNGTALAPIKNIDGVVVELGAFGTSTVTARITNNVIRANNAVASPGIAPGADDTGTMIAFIANNDVGLTDGQGIFSNIRNGATGRITIVNNTVAAPNTTTAARSGIQVSGGSSGASNATVCVDIAANTTAGSTNSGSGATAPGIALRKDSATDVYGVEGMAATDTPGVEQYVGNALGGKNPNTANGTIGNFGVVLVAQTTGFSNCSNAPDGP